MRLAVLGPADGDLAALACAVSASLERLRADQVVYLGVDGALDEVTAEWARVLGVEAPLDERLATDRGLLDDPAEEIAAEVERERARRRLGMLRALPGPGLRALEILNDRVVILVDDKAILDEEDLLPATVIVFGKGDPLIRRIGSRTFASPGNVHKRSEGVLVLDEAEGASIVVSLHDVDGAEIMRDLVDTARTAKLRVHGAV